MWLVLSCYWSLLRFSLEGLSAHLHQVREAGATPATIIIILRVHLFYTQVQPACTVIQIFVIRASMARGIEVGASVEASNGR